MSTSTTASQAELVANKIPVPYRDNCSALLIPLNKCRHKTLYMPWKCEDERHGYEKCQYEDYLRRMKKLSKQKREAAENAE